MSWQTVARGGMQRMHRTAIPLPTGVTSMQTQLRRLCLSTKYTQARPQLQAALPVRFLVQSNAFATTTTDRKTAKKPKAKSSEDKNSETKKRSPRLTKEEKEARDIKQEKAHIKELKAIALTPPKKLPSTFHSCAMQAKVPQLKGQYTNMSEAFKLVSEMTKNMGAEERQQLEAQAKQNAIANAEAYQAWINSHTPLQIKQANIARRELFRTLNTTPRGRKYMQLKDDRHIKKPITAYLAYATERLNSGDFEGDWQNAVSTVGRQWKDIPESDKQRYQKLADEDRARYVKEHEEVYGYIPRALKDKS